MKLAQSVQQAALKAGLMCYPAQGCADGTNGDHILLAPSYTSSEAEITLIVDHIKAAIDLGLDALKDIGS